MESASSTASRVASPRMSPSPESGRPPKTGSSPSRRNTPKEQSIRLSRNCLACALITAAMESARETGNATVLDRALTVARVEVTRLLERVDLAKQAKDTEAAVNLGISAKRLVSAIDEAERL